jgi:hypothetical protein
MLARLRLIPQDDRFFDLFNRSAENTLEGARLLNDLLESYTDVERKARHLATLPSLPDSIAARALVVYHLAEQRPMMAAFLDALGLAHDNGLIQDESAAPDPAKIPDAAAQVARQFPAGQVRLYFKTLLAQDPETWGALRDVPLMHDESRMADGSSA